MNSEVIFTTHFHTFLRWFKETETSKGYYTLQDG